MRQPQRGGGVAALNAGGAAIPFGLVRAAVLPCTDDQRDDWRTNCRSTHADKLVCGSHEREREVDEEQGQATEGAGRCERGKVEDAAVAHAEVACQQGGTNVDDQAAHLMRRRDVERGRRE